MTGEEHLDRVDRAEVVRRRIFEATGSTPPAVSPPSTVRRGPLSRRDSLADRFRDRLPPALQGMGPFGPLHLSALLVVIALVLFLLAWWVTRSGPRGESVPPPASVSAVAVVSTQPPAPAPAPEVVVDVAGRVRHPGVYHLPAGSRVIDALEAAGGVRRNVDLTQVNLAELLTDGEQILILRHPGRTTTSASGGASAASGGPVNINRADQKLLESLPGVGPVTAAAIVSWRRQNGPFGSVDDLVEVSGIGDATLARLRPYVTV